MMEQSKSRFFGLVAAMMALAMIAGGCALAGETDEQTDAGSGLAADGESGDATNDDGGDDTTDSEPADDAAADGDSTDGDATGSDSTEEDSADGDTTDDTAQAGEANVDLSDGAVVTVLDAGAEPRVELRTQVAPGSSETMVMNQTQEIRQEIGGEALPEAGPIGMVIDIGLTAESSGGSLLTYTSVIESVRLDDTIDATVAAQIQPNLDAMLGIKTIAIVDDRGRVLKTELSGLDGIDPTLASTVEQMTTSSQFAHPLPEEAVGVGATWQVTQLLPVNGLEVEQITTYELLTIDGPVVTFGVGAEQIVAPGSEMMAGGATATVVSWDSITSGSITFDLTSMVPETSSQLLATQEFEFGPGAEKTVLKQTIETQIEITAG